MNVELLTRKGKLSLNGASIHIKADGGQTLMLRAELEEGDSPVQIMMEGQSQPIMVRQLRVVDKRRRLVRAFTYTRGKKQVSVHEHYRRMPLHYKVKSAHAEE